MLLLKTARIIRIILHNKQQVEKAGGFAHLSMGYPGRSMVWQPDATGTVCYVKPVSFDCEAEVVAIET
jgi:hypothetical protein